MLAWILDAIAAADVEKAWVIVSPDFGDTRTAAKQFASAIAVEFVKCPDAKLGNGRSAAFAAEVVTSERFYLLMGDHLVSPEHLRVAEACAPDSCALATCAPADWIDIPEATKVSTDSRGRIVQIAKNLTHYDAIDTGVFAMTRALFPALEAAHAAGEHSLTAGNQRLARDGRLYSAPIGELRWCDVDTPADLAAAEAWLTGLRTGIGRPPPSAAGDR
jgi:choline kinase